MEELSHIIQDLEEKNKQALERIADMGDKGTSENTQNLINQLSKVEAEKLSLEDKNQEMTRSIQSL